VTKSHKKKKAPCRLSGKTRLLSLSKTGGSQRGGGKSARKEAGKEICNGGKKGAKGGKKTGNISLYLS